VITLKLLDQLESYYGPKTPCWPTDPYQFLVWWHCGYPASDEACARGWDSLQRTIGVEARHILAASPTALTKALKPGGMVPETRALRLQQIAARIVEEFDNDLSAALRASPKSARKLLKEFPGISDPGADRILLFAGIAPIAAVPSNCPQVLVRVHRQQENPDYAATYREAKAIIESDIPENFPARTRAYLLLKQHGQEICKRTKPRCRLCPINSSCKWFEASQQRTPQSILL